jgi:hypothetical protein
MSVRLIKAGVECKTSDSEKQVTSRERTHDSHQFNSLSATTSNHHTVSTANWRERLSNLSIKLFLILSAALRSNFLTFSSNPCHPRIGNVTPCGSPQLLR